MLLENGVLLTFMVAKHSGDIEAILIDKTLVAKLQARVDHGIRHCCFNIVTISRSLVPRPV